MIQPQPQLLDLYRAGLKSAADLMKTSLESVERLQNQQLAAIRTALEEQAKSVAVLGEAKSVDDLMAIQTRMAGAQFERVMGYWASLSQSQMSEAREWFAEATAQVQAGARSAKQEPRKSA
jgi:phasin family protein